MSQLFVRRADPDDQIIVTELLDSDDCAHFAAGYAVTRRDVVPAIETHFISVIVEDGDGQCVGFAAFDDFPLPGNFRPGSHTWDQTTWFVDHFDLPMLAEQSSGSGQRPDNPIHGCNSVWLHMFIAKMDTQQQILKEVIKSTFNTVQFIEHMFAYVPNGVPAGPFKNPELFTQAYRKNQSNLQHWEQIGDAVWHCGKEDAVTPLVIRKALVEDHDDLTAVFDAQSEVTSQVYGEYFLADLIEGQDADNQCIVAQDSDRHAVGLMALNSLADVHVLAQTFHLKDYDYLVKPAFFQKICAHVQKKREQGQQKGPYGDLFQRVLDTIGLEERYEEIQDKVDDGLVNVVLLRDVFDPDAEEIPDDEFDLYRGIMTVLWQTCWWEPMLQAEDNIPPERLANALAYLREMDMDRRKQIARTALANWHSIMVIFDEVSFDPDEQAELEAQMRAEAEAAAANEGKEHMKQPGSMSRQRTGLGRGSHSHHRHGHGHGHGQGSQSGSRQRSRNHLPENERSHHSGTHHEGDHEGAVLENQVEELDEAKLIGQCHVHKFFEMYAEQFSREDATDLLVVLHWWGNVVMCTNVDQFKLKQLKDALERVADADELSHLGDMSEEDAFGWLRNLQETNPHESNAILVSLFCLDEAYMTLATDFLLPAFSLYPDKEYIIITQPFDSPQTPLLSAFTLVEPKSHSTFSQVLYIVNRAALCTPPLVRSLVPSDMGKIRTLLVHDADAVNSCRNAMRPGQSEEDAVSAFVAVDDQQVVGIYTFQHMGEKQISFIQERYQIDDYLIVEHHKGATKGHCRLTTCYTDPRFEKFQRRLVLACVRQQGKTVLHLDVDTHVDEVPFFKEMLQINSRRPPALKKIARVPTVVASFKNIQEKEDEEDEQTKAQKEVMAKRARSLVTKKLLSENKIPVNARIVVVGASDTGMSFLQSILSVPHLQFTSLTLLAPGGIAHSEDQQGHALVAGAAAYNHSQLKMIMLDQRVRVLDSRMVHIDRRGSSVVLMDGNLVPYDYLVITAGLQDAALQNCKPGYRSYGIGDVTPNLSIINGAMSAADPKLQDLLVEGGTLIKSLIWNPLSYVVVYGRSLNAYCVLQGLLKRSVPPSKIILVLPPRLRDNSWQLPVDAFEEGDVVEEKIHTILKDMGVKVYDGFTLTEIKQDNRERLRAVILEDHSSEDHDPYAVPPQAEGTSRSRGGPSRGQMEDLNEFSENHKPLRLLNCRILITADSEDVDPDVFEAVHENGLVYDGRLIVDHNFQTTDEKIFAGGSLCEFSRRYRSGAKDGKYLRHDGFNGVEVGANLCAALLKILNPVLGNLSAAGSTLPTNGIFTPSSSSGFQIRGTSQTAANGVPEFEMPVAKEGFLPGDLHYYHVSCCRSRAMQSGDLKQEVVVTDTLTQDVDSTHFCRLTVDSFGKISSITYLGKEELHAESLWSLVGLSATFLNHLVHRHKDGDIPDIIEFLTDEWAVALFHDRFMDFQSSLAETLESSGQVATFIDGALQKLKDGDSKNVLSSQFFEDLRSELLKNYTGDVKTMENTLLDFLRKNENHLKCYFIPEPEPFLDQKISP